MTPKTKYKWSYDPNSDTYQIYGVPFFQIFKSKRGAVDENVAQEILKNFYKETQGAGQYPRIFEGHHTDPTNRPPVGFMDNVRFPGDGFFYCDMANVYPDKFQEIKNKKFPYRSVEYDAPTKTITGLALLSTQRPYFTLPMLELEEEESIQLRTNFQSKTYKEFQKMPEDIKPEAAVGMANEDGKPETVMEEKPAESGDDTKAMLKEIISMLAKLMKAETQEAEMQGREMPKEGPALEEKPSSVAYQNMEKKVADLSNRLFQMETKEKAGRYENELRLVCEQSGQDFSVHQSVISKFQRDSDKEHYLNVVKSGSVSFQTNPVAGMVVNRVKKDKTELDAYADKPASLRKIAQDAFQTWNETVEQFDQKSAKQFQNAWPERAAFIKHCVEEEERHPGYFQKSIVG